jgi:hypothetical protein
VCVLRPYKTTGKITVLYILIFTFLGSRREDRRLWTEWWQALPGCNHILLSWWTKFWFVTLIPKYLNFATFSKAVLALCMLWFCTAFCWQHILNYVYTFGPISFAY